MAHGEFSWNELLTRDVDAARRFYGELMGWTFKDEVGSDGTVYVLALANGKPVAGIFDLAARKFGHLRPHWFSYISVDEIDELYAAALRRGASEIRPPHEVPGVGRLAYLEDPTGAAIGWWAPPPARD